MSSLFSRILDSYTTTSQTLIARASTKDDVPNYFASDFATLRSSAAISDFRIGTGADVFAYHADALLSTQTELVLVTCFWARSKSLDTLCDVLRRLSRRAIARDSGQKIRVRICFSSLSILQKLLHTRSIVGKSWPLSTWRSKLGLPDPQELKGLDLKVKSIFITPFSVMHPKFMIIDRQTVLLPSCNVSWEDWLEGCAKLEGDIVKQFCRFYEAFWSDEADYRKSSAGESRVGDIQGVLLPSSHHPNPRLSPLPFFKAPHPPSTPLNTFLLAAFDQAETSIVVTTPNLTCQTVIDALLRTVSRGVNVTIYTSRRMMLLEQLVTAGTITEICVWRMKQRYKRLRKARSRSPGYTDVEAQLLQPGQLQVYYLSPTGIMGEAEPSRRANKLHFKSTIVDDEIVVLGSGNMDRASWYTSQELGVAFASRELAAQVQHDFQSFLTGRGGARYLSQVI